MDSLVKERLHVILRSAAEEAELRKRERHALQASNPLVAARLARIEELVRGLYDRHE